MEKFYYNINTPKRISPCFILCILTFHSFTELLNSPFLYLTQEWSNIDPELLDALREFFILFFLIDDI